MPITARQPGGLLDPVLYAKLNKHLILFILMYLIWWHLLQWEHFQKSQYFNTGFQGAILKITVTKGYMDIRKHMQVTLINSLIIFL